MILETLEARSERVRDLEIWGRRLEGLVSYGGEMREWEGRMKVNEGFEEAREGSEGSEGVERGGGGVVGFEVWIGDFICGSPL